MKQTLIQIGQNRTLALIHLMYFLWEQFSNSTEWGIEITRTKNVHRFAQREELLERDREMLWKLRYSVSDLNYGILLGSDPSTTNLRVTLKEDISRWQDTLGLPSVSSRQSQCFIEICFARLTPLRLRKSDNNCYQNSWKSDLILRAPIKYSLPLYEIYKEQFWREKKNWILLQIFGVPIIFSYCKAIRS